MTNIETRPLGHSGIQVSVVGLGCNQFGGRLDLAGTRDVIDGAIAHGITFLDTADRYGNTKSEEFIGEVLKGRRDEVVLATKFGMDLGDGWDGPRGTPEYIRHAAENSLRRLQTDVIDLYWYHRPDGVTPIVETLAGLDELVRAGKVRAIGASNFSADQIREADRPRSERGLTRFTAIQNEYSLLNREAERDVLPLCEAARARVHPLLPAGLGAPDRQVPARPGGAGGRAAVQARGDRDRRAVARGRGAERLRRAAGRPADRRRDRRAAAPSRRWPA